MMHNKLSVTWRRKNYVVDMNPCWNLKELGVELQRLTNVKPNTMRLIVPTTNNKASKLFYPFSDEYDHSLLPLESAHILQGKSIRMMGVPENEVDELLQNSKMDYRIAGFDEEEKRLRRRIYDAENSSPKLPQGTYIFSEFRTLDLPGVELNPPASEALKLMHRLAADPGIVAIMTKHRWRVGIMSEMAPVGYVGVSPKCILGLNKNHGEEISLRLRTDDLNGFRKYESIRKTLLHELAHMVYSEHDSNFYALDRQLNEESESLNWTKAKGHTLSGTRHSFHSEEEESTNHMSSLQKLGGQASAFSNARESSVAAAYSRFSNSSNNVVRMPEIYEEPDSDYTGFTICQVPDHKLIEGATDTNLTCAGTVQKLAPVHDASHIEFEPDPDSEGGEPMESEPCMLPVGNGTTNEPHANHSEGTVVPIPIAKAMDKTVAGSDSLGTTERLENLDGLKAASLKSDTDDSGLRKDIVDHKNILKPDCSEGVFTKDEIRSLSATSSCMGTFQDDSQVRAVLQSEPDSNDDIIVFAKNMSVDEAEEPDPDNTELQRIQDPVTAICDRLQKSIEVLRSELDPLKATSILQTIIRILQNVIEHPDESKFRKLRKANPIIQRNIMSHTAAMEILQVIGFSEDSLVGGMGNGETYLILKRNDPGLLWLAKSSLESAIS